MSYKVSVKRHLGKTISYRIISTFVGFLIMWYMTGSIKFGAAFGISEIILKPVIYYFHERIWYKRIKFGLVEEKKTKLKKNQLNETELNDVKPESPNKELTKVTPQTGKKVLNYSSNR
jgi:uncharacterized membrane protein